MVASGSSFTLPVPLAKGLLLSFFTGVGVGVTVDFLLGFLSSDALDSPLGFLFAGTAVGRFFIFLGTAVAGGVGEAESWVSTVSVTEIDSSITSPLVVTSSVTPIGSSMTSPLVVTSSVTLIGSSMTSPEGVLPSPTVIFSSMRIDMGVGVSAKAVWDPIIAMTVAAVNAMWRNIIGLLKGDADSDRYHLTRDK